MWNLESNISETVWVGDSHCLWRCDPIHGQGAPFKRLRDHTHWKHHTPQHSSGKVTGLTQRPLPYNTEHSQEKKIHAPGGIRTRNPSK
jgi:hypothetical protein